jgi:putative SOS response-associated peptidase YedK
MWRTDHPEQRPPSLCLRQRAGYPRSQLSTAVERRAEPGPAGHPAQSSDRGTLARSATLGPHTSLVQGPELSGGRKPINAKCETVRNLPTFRDAYRLRRCIVPVDGFFEWKAIKGQKAKQPYAIATKDGKPFGIGGIWENWKDPATGEWIRTFAVITTDANALVAEIHDRMPLILAPEGYGRWLGDEPDPRDLMRPIPPDLMRMWRISTRVNKPENDDASIVEPDATGRCPGIRWPAVFRGPNAVDRN